MTSNGSFISQAISWNMALNEGQRINASSTYLRGLAFILQNASQVWEIPGESRFEEVESNNKSQERE